MYIGKCSIGKVYSKMLLEVFFGKWDWREIVLKIVFFVVRKENFSLVVYIIRKCIVLLN